MSSCTTKMWVTTIVPPWAGSSNLAEDAMLPVCRVRPDLGLPFSEVGRFLPGRAVDDLGPIDLVDRQISRHRRNRRMFEPIARARADPGDLEDGRHVVLVKDGFKSRLEVLRNALLHDKDVWHLCSS